MSTLETPRLLLRRWQIADQEPFATLNGDPETMKFFLQPLNRSESDSLIERYEKHFEEQGFGMWALQSKKTRDLIGATGLLRVTFAAHFTPTVNIGWRLARQHWGNGYATEAAVEALRFGFEKLNLPEIVAFTLPQNTSSRGVMERLGMTHNPNDDFDHPKVPQWHPMVRHVLYRVKNDSNLA